MIRIKGLTKIFGAGQRAIDGLDLEVRQGEILALLGPNGAGKTTTIRVLSTLSGFDEGSVTVAGHDVDTAPEAVRRVIGVVAQQTGVDHFLSGRENLMLQGHFYRMKTAEIEQRIIELASYFDLGSALDRAVMTYSGGMRRKLDIATALIHRPQVLFLDEPTLGLDIKSRQALWQYIDKLNREQGLTILLTTHYLEEADQLSHRVAIINAGKIQVVGTPEELKNSIHGDAVILSFAGSGPEVGALTYDLHNAAEVRGVVWQNDKLHLYVDSGGAAVPWIVNLASQHKVAIKSLSLARPTLDDVFLKYTGTTIADSEQKEEGDAWWKQWAGKGGGNWQKNWQKWQQQIEETGTEEEKQGWQQQWQQWQKPAADTTATETSAAPQQQADASNATTQPQDTGNAAGAPWQQWQRPERGTPPQDWQRWQGGDQAQDKTATQSWQQWQQGNAPKNDA